MLKPIIKKMGLINCNTFKKKKSNVEVKVNKLCTNINLFKIIILNDGREKRKITKWKNASRTLLVVFIYRLKQDLTVLGRNTKTSFLPSHLDKQVLSRLLVPSADQTTS